MNIGRLLFLASAFSSFLIFSGSGANAATKCLRGDSGKIICTEDADDMKIKIIPKEPKPSKPPKEPKEPKPAGGKKGA